MTTNYFALPSLSLLLVITSTSLSLYAGKAYSQPTINNFKVIYLKLTFEQLKALFTKNGITDLTSTIIAPPPAEDKIPPGTKVSLPYYGDERLAYNFAEDWNSSSYWDKNPAAILKFPNFEPGSKIFESPYFLYRVDEDGQPHVFSYWKDEGPQRIMLNLGTAYFYALALSN